MLLRWAAPTQAQCLTVPQSQRRARKAAQETRPNWQPFSLPRLWLVCIHPRGLQRDSQKKYSRVPLPHMTLTRRGPGNYSPDNSTGPQADPGGDMGAVSQSEAAGGIGVISRCLRGEQSRCSPSQLLPEAAPSHPGPDLRVPWPLTCPAGPELPRVGSQAHTLLGTRLGRQGWLRVGAVSAGPPLHLSLQEPRARSTGSGWLLPPGHSPHLFSMSICTLWTRSRAIRRISWAS